MFRFDFNNAGIIHAHLGIIGANVGGDSSMSSERNDFSSGLSWVPHHDRQPRLNITSGPSNEFQSNWLMCLSSLAFFCLCQTLVVKPSVRTFDLDDGKLSCIIKSLEMAGRAASFFALTRPGHPRRRVMKTNLFYRCRTKTDIKKRQKAAVKLLCSSINVYNVLRGLFPAEVWVVEIAFLQWHQRRLKFEINKDKWKVFSRSCWGCHNMSASVLLLELHDKYCNRAH